MSILCPTSSSYDIYLQSGAQSPCTLAPLEDNFISSLNLLAAWYTYSLAAATVVLSLLMLLVAEEDVTDSLYKRSFKFPANILASRDSFLTELLTNHWV